MNDLYCKDFEFMNADKQLAYNDLRETIKKRSKLDLEFLEKFMAFSQTCVCSTRWKVVQCAPIFGNNQEAMNYVTFCAEYLGLSERTVRKLYEVFERFVVCAVDGKSNQKSFSYILPDFNELTLSKLFELLSVSINDLRTAFDSGELHSAMTQKQLRQWVKLHNDGEPTSVDVKEEINDGYPVVGKFIEKDKTPKIETYDSIVYLIGYVKNNNFRSVDAMKKSIIEQLTDLKETLKKEFKLDID